MGEEGGGESICLLTHVRSDEREEDEKKGLCCPDLSVDHLSMSVRPCFDNSNSSNILISGLLFRLT